MTTPGELADIGVALKRVLAEDLRESGLSREEVAPALSAAVSRSITEHMIDAYTAETKKSHRFPAELIGPWVMVLGSRRVIDLILQGTGLCAAGETVLALAEYARVEIQRARLDDEAQRLRGDLCGKV